MFQSKPVNGGGATATFDQFNAGTMFEDVLPAAVPEPTSVGLLAVGATGLLRRRAR